jgi:hypothetical protein
MFREVFLWDILYGKLLSECSSMECTKKIIYAVKLATSLAKPFFTKHMLFGQNSVKISYTEIYDNTINVLSKFLSHAQKDARGLRIRLYLHKMWTRGYRPLELVHNLYEYFDLYAVTLQDNRIF